MTKVIDPTDGKTEYPSYRDMVKHYSRMPGLEPIAMVLDLLASRADLSSPSATVEVVGAAKPVKVAHGCKDTDGVKLKPRAYMLTGWSATDHVHVVSIDDTYIEVDLTDKGTATFIIHS